MKTIIYLALLILIALPVVANAPDGIGFGFKAFNSTSGLEVNGTHRITVNLYQTVGGAQSGTPIFNDTQDLNFFQGVSFLIAYDTGLQFDTPTCYTFTLNSTGEESNCVNITASPQSLYANLANLSNSSLNTSYFSSGNYLDLINTPDSNISDNTVRIATLNATMNGTSTTDEIQDLSGLITNDTTLIGNVSDNRDRIQSLNDSINASSTTDEIQDLTGLITNDTTLLVNASNMNSATTNNVTGGTQTGITVSHTGNFFNFILDVVNSVITSFSNFISFDAGLSATTINSTNVTVVRNLSVQLGQIDNLSMRAFGSCNLETDGSGFITCGVDDTGGTFNDVALTTNDTTLFGNVSDLLGNMSANRVRVQSLNDSLNGSSTTDEIQDLTGLITNDTTLLGNVSDLLFNVTDLVVRIQSLNDSVNGSSITDELQNVITNIGAQGGTNFSVVTQDDSFNITGDGDSILTSWSGNVLTIVQTLIDRVTTTFTNNVVVQAAFNNTGDFTIGEQNTRNITMNATCTIIHGATSTFNIC